MKGFVGRFALFAVVGGAAWAAYVMATKSSAVAADVAFKSEWRSYGTPLVVGGVSGAALLAWLVG